MHTHTHTYIPTYLIISTCDHVNMECLFSVALLSPDGYLYERQAILEYILHQKTEIAKKMKAYEKQKQAQKSNSQLESKSEERERVERFKNQGEQHRVQTHQPIHIRYMSVGSSVFYCMPSLYQDHIHTNMDHLEKTVLL
uniref:Uncharacterized protein n=1 Tax=Lates calcarifer TaxID=8187 RepID=A0A4W6E3T3_LATCA